MDDGPDHLLLKFIFHVCPLSEDLAVEIEELVTIVIVAKNVAPLVAARSDVVDRAPGNSILLLTQKDLTRLDPTCSKARQRNAR